MRQQRLRFLETLPRPPAQRRKEVDVSMVSNIPVEPVSVAMSQRPGAAEPSNLARSADRRRWLPRRSRADVQLIGRVGADPDVRFANEASDGAWARFSVATEAPNGHDDVPDWHTVIVHDRLAQFVARYVTRGRLVHVMGWLTYHAV